MVYDSEARKEHRKKLVDAAKDKCDPKNTPKFTCLEVGVLKEKCFYPVEKELPVKTNQKPLVEEE
jgi:hypothetical protein